MIYLLIGLLSFTAMAQNNQTTFLTCDSNTPTIDLEQEVPFPGATIRGPLFNVPQDHQDGIGTCYANVSRNLLIGLSGGRDSASYLDLALAYKRTQRSRDLLMDGLDAGEICPTLEAARQQGFCPQERAPLETGARTEIATLLGVENDPFVAQANINQALRNFFARTEESRDLPVPASLLPRLRDSISRLRSDSNITLPFPGLEVPFVPGGMFKNATMPDGVKGTPDSLYEYALNSVRPKIMQAILQNKSPGEMYDIFSRDMAPFFQRMNITPDPELRDAYISRMTAAMNAPGVRDRIRATMSFLRNVSGRTEDSEESFVTHCTTEFYPAVEILNTLGPVVNSLNAMGINPDVLVKEDGNLTPMEDVFQLAVAPTCLSRENRRNFSAGFNCDDSSFEEIKNGSGSQSQKITAVRSLVVRSLLQGIPVGRAFPMPTGGGHVNTIVGYGFNNGSCAWRVRDSASGDTIWVSERDMLEESDEMSIVSRRP